MARSIVLIVILLHDVQCQLGPPISSTFGIKFGGKTDVDVTSPPNPITITLFWEQLKFQCTVNPQISADPLGFFSCNTIGNTNTMECDGTANPTSYGVQIDTQTSPDYMGIDIVKIESIYSSNTITFESDWFYFKPYNNGNYQTYFYLHEDETQHTKGNIGNKFLVIFNDGSTFQPNGTKLLAEMGNNPSISRLESMSTFAVCSTPNPSKEPSVSPSYNPSISPSKFPTLNPTNIPSKSPTNIPSKSAANIPTISPTNIPTVSPSNIPSTSPTNVPIINPTLSPIINPTLSPSVSTNNPTLLPTNNPTFIPTDNPSMTLTFVPTSFPTDTVQSTIGLHVSTEKTQNTEKIIVYGGILCICILCCVLILIVYYKKKQKRVKTNAEQMEMQKISSINSINSSNNIGEINEPNEQPGAITLKSWLTNIDLMEYFDIFVENGFGVGHNTDATLFDLNDEDLMDMGITKVAHKKLILNQIKHSDDSDMSNDSSDSKSNESMFGNVVHVDKYNLGPTRKEIPQQHQMDDIEDMYSNKNTTNIYNDNGTHIGNI